MFDPTTFDYHDAVLRGENPEPPVDTPQAGFYRLAIKVDGVVQRVGVIYWYAVIDVSFTVVTQLHWRIGRDNSQFTESEARAKWNFCARSAIDRDAYEEWWKTGRWSDVDTAASQAIGANQLEGESLYEKIKRTLDDLLDVSAYATITDDEQEKRAKTRTEALRTEANAANAARVEEKAPHLAAERAVDAKWNALIDKASEAIASVKKAMKVYETQLIETRKAEAAKQRESDPTYQQPPEPPRKIKGGIGRGTTVKPVKIAIVVDVVVVATYFKDNDELQALLTKLAQWAHNQGVVIPGIRLVDDIKL